MSRGQNELIDKFKMVVGYVISIGIHIDSSRTGLVKNRLLG